MKVKSVFLFVFIMLIHLISNASNSAAIKRKSCTDQDLFRKAVLSIVPKNQGVYERIHHACFNSEKSKVIIQAKTGINYDEETLYLVNVDKSTCSANGVSAVNAPLPANFGKKAPLSNWDFSSVVNCTPYRSKERSHTPAHSFDQQDFEAVE